MIERWDFNGGVRGRKEGIKGVLFDIIGREVFLFSEGLMFKCSGMLVW